MDVTPAIIGAIGAIIAAGLTVQIWLADRRGKGPAAKVDNVANVWELWVESLQEELMDCRRRLEECENRERRRRTT